jgi:hypothetical protein
MRKLFMMLAVVAAMSGPAAQAAEDGKFATIPDVALTNDPVQRAQFVVNMFFASCFMNFFNPERIPEWADQYMNLVVDEDAAPFLKAVSAKEGKVWYAALPGGRRPMSNDVVPGGEFALVNEPGKCHIVGIGADEQAFHAALEKFSKDAKSHLKGREIAYDYRAKGEAPKVKGKSAKPVVNNTSFVTIHQPKNGVTVTIFGTSAPGKIQEVTSMITIFSNAKLPEPPKPLADPDKVSKPAAK